MIVLLVAWMSVRGQREALLLIPAGGLVLGLLDSEPLGLAMLGAGAAHPVDRSTRDAARRVATCCRRSYLLRSATLSYEITILLTLAVTGEQLDWLASVLDVLVPAAIANVLLLLPVYGIIRLASLDLRQRRAI